MDLLFLIFGIFFLIALIKSLFVLGRIEKELENISRRLYNMAENLKPEHYYGEKESYLPAEPEDPPVDFLDEPERNM